MGCAGFPEYLLTSCVKNTGTDLEQTTKPTFIVPLAPKCFKVWQGDRYEFNTLKQVLQNGEQKPRDYLWADHFAVASRVLCISQAE